MVGFFARPANGGWFFSLSGDKWVGFEKIGWSHLGGSDFYLYLFSSVSQSKLIWFFFSLVLGNMHCNWPYVSVKVN